MEGSFRCDKCKQYHTIELGDSVFLDHQEYFVMGSALERSGKDIIISFEVKK